MPEIRFGSRVRVIAGPFLAHIGRVGTVLRIIQPSEFDTHSYVVRFPVDFSTAEGVLPDIKFYDHEVELAT